MAYEHAFELWDALMPQKKSIMQNKINKGVVVLHITTICKNISTSPKSSWVLKKVDSTTKEEQNCKVVDIPELEAEAASDTQ